MIRIKHFVIAVLLLLPAVAFAQSYADSITTFRAHYKQDFLTDAHSPLKADDTAFLRFYAPDERFRVTAVFTATPNSPAFDMPTHSGKTKRYRQYGAVTFMLHKKKCTLQVLQGIDLIKNPELKDYLFLPFTDPTNMTETFGGGRYLDLRMGDIKGGRVVLDFNTCYNMYCAYAGGYSCPVPPRENDIPVPVTAGEKKFGKPVKE